MSCKLYQIQWCMCESFCTKSLDKVYVDRPHNINSSYRPHAWTSHRKLPLDVYSFFPCWSCNSRHCWCGRHTDALMGKTWVPDKSSCMKPLDKVYVDCPHNINSSYRPHAWTSHRKRPLEVHSLFPCWSCNSRHCWCSRHTDVLMGKTPGSYDGLCFHLLHRPCPETLNCLRSRHNQSA